MTPVATLRKNKCALNTVLFAEFGLLVLGETSEERVEIWNHGFVLLNNLTRISSGNFPILELMNSPP
jgi:hypothetical protein